MSTIVFSNQSSLSFIYISVGRYQTSMDSSTDGGRTMAKTKTTPRAHIPTSVTAAAKWPNKTKKFLASIDAALNIFNDQVSSIDNRRETAYKSFSKVYREAFADICVMHQQDCLLLSQLHLTFPSSMDGARSQNCSNLPRPLELDNQTPPAMSNRAQFGV